ncbi:unnamed protein product, partial [Closterium sp. NIES-53]
RATKLAHAPPLAARCAALSSPRAALAARTPPLRPERRPCSPARHLCSPARHPYSPARRPCSPARRPCSPVRRPCSPAHCPCSPALLAAETSVVAVGAARGTPRTPFFEGCSPSPLAPSYASAAAVHDLGSEDVGAASASGKRRSSKGKGGRSSGGGSGGGGGGGGSGVGGGSGGGGSGGSGGGSGGFGGGGGGSGGSSGIGGSGSGGSRGGASIEPSGPYPELVGYLMYLMTCTPLDLAYPLSILACYIAPGRHRPEHWEAAKRVLRYLCSTSGMWLVLGGRGLVVLIGHAYASWVDDLATQRPSQGYTFSLGSGSVSWWSTRSSSVLSSSCEAEIYAGAMAAQELRWLTYLLTDLGERPRSSPFLYVDNKAMIALCQEHRLEHRTKHIALRYFLS